MQECQIQRATADCRAARSQFGSGPIVGVDGDTAGEQSADILWVGAGS